LLAARGVVSADQWDVSLATLPSPQLLKGCSQAADVLADALASQSNILFVGDFDADGATSTALGVQALRAFGADSVDYLVPNRFEFGYGLTPAIVAVAEDRAPELLITVDNGISSVEGVQAAKALGWQVIITDHHLPGDEIPNADVIVNPNQPGCEFPSKAMAGVGVLFYVMMALRVELRRRKWFQQQQLAEPNLACFLDLVALGTVADVVPLDRINRILVEQGLRRLRAGKCRPGIAALLELAGRQPSRLVSADLGFAVGPRLNAAGRLDDMSLGIECLLASQADAARVLASRLDELNQERKAIEQEMQGDAHLFLQQLQDQTTDLPCGLCLYDASWHQGVIGILASRVKERVHRPVIAFAQVSDEEMKGSARSVAGLHVRDCLDAVAKKYPGLLTKFGGHAMAAGLSIHIEQFALFRDAFNQQVQQILGDAPMRPEICTDGKLAALELSMQSAEDIRYAAPWGQGFPEPCFDGVFRLVNKRIVGGRHLKVTLCDQRTNRYHDGIQFNAETSQDIQSGTEIMVVYRLDINEYRGQRQLQLLIDYIEPLT